MFLSKVVLDIRHPSVRQALRDANDMHRNLMAGFEMNPSQTTPRADGRILYRLFTGKDQMYLLVSSEEKPNAEALAARGLYVDDTGIRDVSRLREAFVPGKCLRFELLASPCKKVSGSGKNSRRVFLSTAAERLEWLRRKGEQGGFQVLQADELGGRTDVCGRRGVMELNNSGVLFSGLLRITDGSAFWKSYTDGIGPGKAYGMGMLNLARA